MIKTLRFKSEKTKHSLSYARNLPSIKSMDRVVEFKEGLNIIVGPVGSGKSTILKSIAEYMAADQFGESCLSVQYLMNFISFKMDDSDNETISSKMPFELVHDGNPVLFADPKRSNGLSNGRIDSEASAIGFLEHFAMNEESSGEQSLRRINPYLEILKGEAPVPEGLGSTFNIDEINSTYEALVKEYVQTIFTGSLPKSQVTVLLDEPEKSLGLIEQLVLWEQIIKNKDIQDKFQIILVSHDTQSLNIEGANYIETKKGYIDACKSVMNKDYKMSDLKTFSLNIEDDLTPYQLDLLNKINLSKRSYKPLKKTKKIKETLAFLIEINFIEAFEVEVEDELKSSSSISDRVALSFSRFNRKYETLYRMKRKGIQYLSM